MINVSDEFKEVLANGGQLYMTVDVEYADGTTETWDDEIMQGQNTIVDGAESATFPMGVAIEKYMTLCIDNRYDEFAEKSLYMAVLRPKISLQLDEEPIPTDPDFVGTAVVGSAKTSHKTTPRVETVRRGKFTVTTPETYGEIINITAVDDMYKADQSYYTNLTLPQSIYTLVREACDICGIPMGFSSMTHGGYIVNTIPEDITFRAFLAYAAMIECANARIDIYGNLQFVKWDFNSYKGSSAVVGKAIVGAAKVGDDGSSFVLPRYIHQIEDFKSSPTFSSDDVVVTGVLVKTRKEEYQFGNDGYVLEFQNLLAEDGTEDLATIATWLGEKLVGATFRTMAGDVYSDPTIEFGDSALSYRYVASLGEAREYFTPITDVSFYLQGYTTIKTQAEDPIRLSSAYNTEAAKALSEAKALTDEVAEEMGEAIEEVSEAVEDEAAKRAAAIEAEAEARAAAIQSVEDATNAAIERLAERLSESSGLYMTVETQPDGSNIYYMHNKPTLAESDIIWKLTAEAFAISTDYGETYPYGFTVDGEVIARILSAEGINASWINTGAIIIKNDSGGIMFQADMDLNSLLINTGQFVLDSAGNATFSGTLSAPVGNIGGWTIGTDALYYGSDSFVSEKTGVYLGTVGIRVIEDSDYVTIWGGAVENGLYNTIGSMSLLSKGTLGFYYDGVLAGEFQATNLQADQSIRGVNMAVSPNANYVSFGQSDGSGAVSIHYRINYGAISERSERHLFYGDVYIGSSIRVIGRIYVSSDDTAYISSVDGGLYFYGDMNVHGDTYMYGSTYITGYRLYLDNTYYISASTSGGLYCNGSVTGVTAIRAGSTYWSAYILSADGDAYINGYLTAITALRAGSRYYSAYVLSVYGDAYASGTFYDGSDEALKTDIKDIKGSDSIIDSLSPITFRYIDDEKKKMHFGVTYQNVIAALESAGIDPDDAAIVSVAMRDDGVESGAVAYNELIGLLIYEVKALKAEVQALKSA